MIRLVPEPTAEIADPLRRILGNAVAAGASPPGWVAVADRDGHWLTHAMSATPVERAAAVVAVETDADLAGAVELGFGGALWLPPSTPAARDALASAAVAAELPTPVCDPRLVDLLTGRAPVLAVSFANLDLWRRELGTAHLLGLLARLADRLGEPPVLVEAPALLLSGSGEAGVRAAWSEETEHARYVPQHGLTVAALETGVSETTTVASAVREEAAIDRGGGGTMRWRSMWEIPQGRKQGCWAAEPVTGDRGEGWWARPEGPAPAGHRWRMVGPEGEERDAIDAVAVETLASAAGSVVRLPARLTVTMRAGSPTALLAARLIEEARRRHLAVWVSGVDNQALEILLRLQTTMWVDGPAVPEE